uniref:Uncharacterized protein n=1 Tax=Oryza brachyantha TaxID=4533 RepID=J3MZV2_ORYBR
MEENVSAWLNNSMYTINDNDKKTGKYWGDVAKEYKKTTEQNRWGSSKQAKELWHKIESSCNSKPMDAAAWQGRYGRMSCSAVPVLVLRQVRVRIDSDEPESLQSRGLFHAPTLSGCRLPKSSLSHCESGMMATTATTTSNADQQDHRRSSRTRVDPIPTTFERWLFFFLTAMLAGLSVYWVFVATTNPKDRALTGCVAMLVSCVTLGLICYGICGPVFRSNNSTGVHEEAPQQIDMC